MTRCLRIQFPGAYYHIFNRGVAKGLIVHDDQDRKTFFKLTGEMVQKYDIRLYAYCLMTNHFHFFLETVQGNLEKAIWYLCRNYVNYFNNRHKRVGPLFQGRYRHRLVQTELYALTLTRYIHQNPMEANLILRLDDYPWSSYASYIGRNPAWPWLNTQWILNEFSGEKKVAVERFKQFHLTAASENERKEFRRTYPILGDKEFETRWKLNLLSQPEN